MLEINNKSVLVIAPHTDDVSSVAVEQYQN